MDKLIEDRINQIIESIMGLDVSTMDNSTKLNTISEWDSFNNLMLISKLQDEFKINFTPTEIEEAQTIVSIFDLIDKKIAK